jgi:hypothetical protein
MDHQTSRLRDKKEEKKYEYSYGQFYFGKKSLGKNSPRQILIFFQFGSGCENKWTYPVNPKSTNCIDGGSGLRNNLAE